MAILDILTVFPHCDMHLALNTPGANRIDLRVFAYNSVLAADDSFQLHDVTAASTVRLIAPHNPSGRRLQEFVTVNLAAKTITPRAVGTNLLVIQHAGAYIVARVQVHDRMLAWWFGNASVTTALDAAHAHAQPSIYATFSDDAQAGTDRVGDITGHGFVTLTSQAPATFTVDNTNHAGRLRGLVVTPDPSPAELEGTFLALTERIKVNVVNYAAQRDILEQVHGGGVADVDDKHNILFLAEGFTGPEENRFVEFVTKAKDQLLSRPRHEPYATLKGGFNVFRAFVPSQQNLLTPGYQVVENAFRVDFTEGRYIALPEGRAIPDSSSVSVTGGNYTIAQLIERVGLPRRGEARDEADLKTLWAGQTLHDFNPALVNRDLANAWKNSHARGIVEARDGFFGMMQGARWADRSSGTGAALPAPANEQDAAGLAGLVARAYEFYRPQVPTHFVVIDPRRHPPQLYCSALGVGDTMAMVTFLAGLRMAGGAHEAIGNQWTPAAAYKKSRGLIAMVCNDPMFGGAATPGLLTAVAIGKDKALATDFAAAGEIRRLRRSGGNPDIDLNTAVDVIAHEFGHSFNLGDEYERFSVLPADFKRDFLDPADPRNERDLDGYDNIASLEVVFHDPHLNNQNRTIDPAKLKWATLPRIKLSARLAAAPALVGGNIEVFVDPREAPLWARIANEPVHLRRVKISPAGRQLPLSAAPADHLADLTISAPVNLATGKIVLTSATPVAALTLTAGTLMFVPHRVNNVVLNLIDAKVLAHMTTSHAALNKDTDTVAINKEPDFPVDIANFDPPCRSATLVGAFEGAGTFTGLVYRPTGTCKMRNQSGAEENGEFCHVCKWLLTNRIDASKHGEIDKRFYPKSKKNG